MTATAQIRTLAALVGLFSAAIVSPTADAAILSYSFTGVAGPGSSINLGAGAVDVSGVTFTASGQTLNDVDVFNGGAVGDGVGLFATTATYDFGVFGSFVTDIGGDFYGQNCAGPLAVTCALLSDVNASVGFRIDFSPAVAGDADFGIPLGSQIATGFQINTRTQTNALGHSLTIATGGSISSVTANAVPEPGSLALLGLGLAGLAATRRRKQ